MDSFEIIGRDPETEESIRLTCDHGLVARIERVSVETDHYLSSGFIDLQVNGYAGFDLNAENISIETVIGLVDAMLANGVTCFAPTLITASEERICLALRVIAQARKLNSKVAECIPSIHIEGPGISPSEGYKGAHPGDSVRPPSIAEFDRWQQAAEGRVGMVTLSPHYDGVTTYIRALVSRGVHVAIGHTHASPEHISSAVDAGATLSTHLGNGIAELLPRHRNPIWTQLADDRLTATFIADGHHLPTDVLKTMLRAKGLSRSILVSDSVALAGMPPGTYKTSVGGEVELQADGRLCLMGSEYLAGSTATLAECIANVMLLADIPLKDALRMATVNPGTFMHGRGRLKVGARADLVRFRCSDTLAVDEVWLSGVQVYKGRQREGSIPGKEPR